MSQTLSRQVTLLSGQNLFEVRLRSAPGSFVTIELFRLDQHTCPVLGLYTFIRSTGKPVEETVTFDLPPQFVEPFVLNVTSGSPDGLNRVDSATITLNGMLLFDPNDFNEQAGFLSQVVSLLPTNTLNVQLSGAPGDLLTIEIIGYDNTSPSVTITSPSNGTTFSTSPITVSGIVDDPNASVTANGISTAVASDGSFTIEGLILQEGENQIKVIAVDTCGNQGEDQIVVYLRTGPEGPSLILCAEPFREQVPEPPGEDCSPQAFGRYYGVVTGLTDETAISVTLNGILMPNGVEIIGVGDINWGMREGNFFWAFVIIPQVDGIHPFTAVATNSEGGHSQTSVTFLRDTVPPRITITSPTDGLITSSQTVIVTGTVDDPEATVRLGWGGPKIPVVNGMFTTQVALIWEGTNSITITARDIYSNSSYVTLRVIRDTIPPQINISNPADGMAVNTTTLSVMGSITDQNKDIVTVAVNDGPPQSLNLVGNNFSGTVTLSPGSNMLTFHAVDKAGNESQVSRSVLLDLDLPTVAIGAPQPGALISGLIMVMVEANDASSGIASVTLYVDGQAQTTLNQSPFNFTLDTSTFTSGLHTITVRAIDRAGNQAEASISATMDNTPPNVAITAPVSGTAVSGSIIVSVQASDAVSGIASVSFFVNGQFQATVNQPPYDFLMNTLLFTSGSHTITARGVDNAGNQAEASILIIFDHLSPTISIVSPASGSTVSGTITITVEATDPISGVASVTLFVDGQSQTVQNQPPFAFVLNSLLFSSGPHTITARGVDNAGNQAEGSISIIFDHLPPDVSITSPASGSTVSGTIAVTVETSDSISGVVSVTLSVDSQPHSTLSQPPFSFTVDTSVLAPGPHTLAARASDSVGNEAEASITITVAEPISIEITSPASGSTVNKSSIIIQGRIYNQTGEVGVVVNGILAEVQGSNFAVIVPLQICGNTITATATRPDGLQGQAQITINTESQREFVRLTATPTSGILDQTGILNVTFEAEAYLLNPVSSYSWDFNGDGIPEITGIESTVIAQYQSPGLYFPRVTVTDNQGNTYTETTMVNVLSRDEMDALLRSKWEGMKGALGQGNINEALNYFIEDSKEEYQEIFELLASQLPALVSAMGEINMVEVKGNMAEYHIKRFQRGLDISYFIYFIKDGNGIWRISSF